MAFLSELMVISCLLAFHMAAGNINMTVTHQRVNPLTTKNFILNCRYEDKNKQVLSLQLSKVFKKGPGASVLKKIASINRSSNLRIFSHSPDVRYNGGIYAKGKVYLSVKWNRVPICFGGNFKCHVAVVDTVGHVEKFDRQLKVTETKMIFAESLKAIKELQTSEYQLQAWKERMVSSFHFLDVVILKASYSRVYKAKYYIAYNHASDFIGHAETFCQFRGGYLAELNDFNEWKFVSSLIRRVGKNREGFYISGRRNVTDNNFYWHRNGLLRRGYFHWGRTQPDNYKGIEKCVHLNVYFNWRMNDIICKGRKDGFICEIPKGS